MSANNSAYLQAAIILAIEIDVIYAGGSHPGSMRRIRPRSLHDGLLRATIDDAIKTFRTDLLSLPFELVASEREYHGIQDILFREQKLILASGMEPSADRFHLTLKGTDGLFLALTCSHSTWSVNGHKCNAFQSAADLFIACLKLILIRV